MKYFSKILIHSCFASSSSNDVLLYKKLSKENFKNMKFDRTFGDDKIQIGFYENKTFYVKALGEKKFGSHYENTQEFIKLVEYYTNEGYSKEYPKEVEAYYSREEKKGYEKAKTEGFFLCSKSSDEYTTEDFRGGLSNTTLENEILKKYIGNGKEGVHGYIGNRARTVELDKCIEITYMMKFFDIENSFDIFCTWLTSIDGRHFGDFLEGLDFEQQKQKINDYVKNIFKLGFLYSRPEHTGTLDSTDELQTKYNDYIVKVFKSVELISK